MHRMCQYCGGAQTKTKDENRTVGLQNPLKPNDDGQVGSCRFCQEKLEEESIKRDGLNSAIRKISPTTSLSSSDRSISSCSDISVDVNSRGNHEDSILESVPGNNDCDGVPRRTVEIRQIVNGQEAKDSCFDNNSVGNLDEGNKHSHCGDDEFDSQVWEPPDAEDPEDDMEGSVAFNDDDDDCVDGMKWGKPSSLSCCRDEVGGSHSFFEERKLAMEEVKSGKFKAAVCQLLKNEGVNISGKDGENWGDIVTSLSWEAALFLRPDTINEKAMDPDGYVKVKCVAAGSHSESQVIKGLVFKKHAAHKHMATKYKKPRLLLIRGVLGQSSSVLSSFKAMEQENDNLKSVLEMIETCQPNLVLVEKSVSRDVQESILAKGITLVYDMKLHRLERVARCTGSPILSSDTLTSQKLKQCDSFRIEKYVEEYAGSGEGGKKPSKTLLFIEGCPTHLGCTILLKGSHSDELKKIKNVVQHAVTLAYHLIVETSFNVDWKSMLSTGGVVATSLRDQPSDLGSDTGEINCGEESISESAPSTIDVTISNDEDSSQDINVGSEDNSSLFFEPYNPAIFSGFSSLSASLKKVLGYSFPLSSANQYQSLSNYFGFNRRETDGQVMQEVPVLKPLEASGRIDMETEDASVGEKSLDDRKLLPLSSFNGSPEKLEDVEIKENKVNIKDDVDSVLNSQSILVLMSSCNALRGTICKQRRFSHIVFYRNFDVPLSKFLRDNLLNQNPCKTCGEWPESHIYSYAHHNKQLTIRMRQLMKILPGEAVGKIWMWTCCGKCKQENGDPKSTKRVLVSTLAGNLSFGKFLELSFASHGLSAILASCGHSLERDFFYFFGVGPMAAMFTYSPVTTYIVLLPPQKVEFSHYIKGDASKQELEYVYMKGMLLFHGVEEALKKLRSQFVGMVLNLQGSLKEFSNVEDILKHEISDFEASICNVMTSGDKGKDFYKFLSLNWLLWELLLQAYTWDQRLSSLLLPNPSVVSSGAPSQAKQKELKSHINDKVCERNLGTSAIKPDKSRTSDGSDKLKDMLDAAADDNTFIKEIPVDGPAQKSKEDDVAEDSQTSNVGRSNNVELVSEANDSGICQSNGDSFQENYMPLPGYSQEERLIPISADAGSRDCIVDPETSKIDSSPHSFASHLGNSSGWFWMPFSEIQHMYMKHLQQGSPPRFQCSNYIQEHISAAYDLIMEEGPRLHVPLGSDSYIVRDYDGEHSSIIACALAYLKDSPIPTGLSEDGRKEGVKSTESSHIFTRIPTIITSHFSNNGSSDSDSIHFNSSISHEESRLSSFDGLNLLESLVPPENLSPEVSLGVSKSLPKGKYSVICLYAKQFRDLRNCCCPELDYIASLSRCKNWDAKGGKSKSFFAKTLDDRFIIKEVKKTEFESFVKFAPHYFKYMNESFEFGNQTCLAKVLGIYQVIIRQTKSGKEMRHDLMVMENLSFGRKINRQYDLKGALHARFNSSVDNAGDVLLDQNFVNDMNSSPLHVSNKAKHILERAVWNDTYFLNSINVMDYSLLVGVDTQRRELVCGIIDYLRQYTWDKQLETWVKSSLVVPKNVLPTIISPKEYKKRFRKFMSEHFLSVPDKWCMKRSSDDSCELSSVRDSSSTQLKPQNQGVNGFSQ